MRTCRGRAGTRVSARRLYGLARYEHPPRPDVWSPHRDGDAEDHLPMDFGCRCRPAAVANGHRRYAARRAAGHANRPETQNPRQLHTREDGAAPFFCGGLARHGSCPVATENLRKLQDRLGDRMEKDIVFYSITRQLRIDTSHMLVGYTGGFAIEPAGPSATASPPMPPSCAAARAMPIRTSSGTRIRPSTSAWPLRQRAARALGRVGTQRAARALGRVGTQRAAQACRPLPGAGAVEPRPGHCAPPAWQQLVNSARPG